MSEPLETLNKQWKSTCRIIFGREVGEMQRYEEWLCEGLEPVNSEKSILSGKETFAVGGYEKGSQFISLDEIDQSKNNSALDLNSIKDIDSILNAIGENFVYTGNIVLGNSSNVDKCTGLEDCNFAYRAHTNHSSSYLAYFSIGRLDKCLFGCCGTGESSHCIKTEETWKASRCLMINRVWESAAVYYSHGLFGCSDCMFSFNMRGKRNLIGNVQLTPEKYGELKTKLVEELADILEKKKRLPSLSEIVPKGKPKMFPTIKIPKSAEKNLKKETKIIENAFAQTSEIVLGKKLDLHALENYLLEHVRGVKEQPSCLSGRPVYYFDMGYDKALANTERLIKLDEQEQITPSLVWPAGFDNGEKASFAKISELIDGICFFCPELEIQSSNMIECSGYQQAHNGYRSSRAYFTKYSAFCFWPRDCDHVFGCDAIRNSSFCISCYNSYKLTRCFEADTCQNCSSSYFLHNCENVHDSMFCFNAKNLRYAIGNQEIGKEEFAKVKDMILDEIVRKLEKDKRIEQNIYNIGITRKR